MLQTDRLVVEFLGDSLEIPQTNGVRQGSPESPVIFAAAIAHCAPTAAPDSALPEAGLEFMDDAYVWASGAPALQQLTNSFLAPLGQLGLAVNPEKTLLVASTPALTGATITIDGHTVRAQPPTTPIEILGALQGFRIPCSQDAQRAAHRAHKVFGAYRDVLCDSLVSLRLRLILFNSVITTKALWSSATWHPSQHILKFLNTTQLHLLRQITTPKRRPAESWTDWHLRSLREARALLHHNKQQQWSTIALTRVYNLWADLASVPAPDVTHSLLHWRNLHWWEKEHRFNSSLERMFRAAAAPEPWNRVVTSHGSRTLCLRTFLHRIDVSWDTGSQPSLENLSPVPPYHCPSSTATSSQTAAHTMPPDLTPTFSTTTPLLPCCPCLAPSLMTR